ncbi:MAG: hypothetical protein KDJ26_06875 [Alphaproteobacteria bacterium]|nr:hypothetical protein [Alphaproteobacteria bacterium]
MLKTWENEKLAQMKKSKDLSLSFQTVTLTPPNIPWESKWDTDTQPVSKSIEDHTRTARQLRAEFLTIAKKLLTLAPFAILKDDQGQQYTLLSIDTLIEYLEDHPDDNRFLKDVSSSRRKLVDPTVNQNPNRILDYLRFQILINTPQEAATLRNALLCEEPIAGITVTSYKDQLRRPCEEGGHAALKCHIKVGDMLAELQISIKGLEEEEFPKLLRRMEREIRAASIKSSTSYLGRVFKVATQCQEIADSLQARRRFVNYALLNQLGFWSMFDNNINPEKIMSQAQQQFEKLSTNAKGIWSKLNSCKKVINGMRKFFH